MNNSKNSATSLACLPEYEPNLVRTFNLPAGKCFFVIDKTILNRSWGGFRVVDDLSLDEVKVLARTMTVKNMLAGIPLGGAKGGMCILKKNYDNSLLTDSISKVIGPFLKNRTYFMGTDLGFKEENVNSIYVKSGSSMKYASEQIVGENCAHGVFTCIEYLKKTKNLDLDGGTIALEGFGRLGVPTAKLLSSKGFKIVAVSNINGAIFDPNGLDIDDMISLATLDIEKMISSYLKKHPNSTPYPKEAINALDCDILIPGARTFIIDHSVASNLKAKIVCPLSNAPVTSFGEDVLAKRGIISVPDVISNSGGVIGGMAQQLGSNTVYSIISKIIQNNLDLVFNKYEHKDIPKIIACNIAYKRLRDLERHQKIGSSKLLFSWIRDLGYGTIWNVMKKYWALKN